MDPAEMKAMMDSASGKKKLWCRLQHVPLQSWTPVQEAQEESKVADVDEVADDVPALPGQAGLAEVRVPVGRPGLLLVPDDHYVRPSLPSHRFLPTTSYRCQHSEGSVDWIPGGATPVSPETGRGSFEEEGEVRGSSALHPRTHGL